MKKIAKDMLESLVGHEKYSLSIDQRELLYPIDLIFTIKNENQYYLPKDESGIPIKIYKSVGSKYSPTRVAAYGLAHWNNYVLENCDKSKNEFLKVLNWFVQTNV